MAKNFSLYCVSLLILSHFLLIHRFFYDFKYMDGILDHLNI